eukprot:EG_transcript_39397
MYLAENTQILRCPGCGVPMLWPGGKKGWTMHTKSLSPFSFRLPCLKSTSTETNQTIEAKHTQRIQPARNIHGLTARSLGRRHHTAAWAERVTAREAGKEVLSRMASEMAGLSSGGRVQSPVGSRWGKNRVGNGATKKALLWPARARGLFKDRRRGSRRD